MSRGMMKGVTPVLGGPDFEKRSAEAAKRARELRESEEEAQRMLQEENDKVAEQVRLATQRMSDRAAGTTQYGGEVSDTAQSYLDRNRTQADMERQGRIRRREGESPGDHLTRLGMREGGRSASRLEQMVEEEKNFQADADYTNRLAGLHQYLSGQRSPELQRLASEFVQNYPREYRRILAQRRGAADGTGGTRPETIPFDQELMDRIEQDPSIARPGSGAPREISAERRNMRAQRRAAQLDDARGRFITGASRRFGDNPKALEGAIRRWNSRNPDNPVMLSDFDTLETARPGDVVSVDNMSQLRGSNVAPNVIINGPRGLRRTQQRDGKLITQAVLQDQETGHFYPDPDAFNTNESFDKALTRQDRVNLRSSVLNSGNAMLVQEQRALDYDREQAIKSIPEIRDAALSQIAELESGLHWRYASSFAQLQGIPSYTGESREQYIEQPSNRRDRAEAPPTMADVTSKMEELRAIDVTDPRSRTYRDMSDQELRQVAIEMVQQQYIDSQTPLFDTPPHLQGKQAQVQGQQAQVQEQQAQASPSQESPPKSVKVPLEEWYETVYKPMKEMFAPFQHSGLMLDNEILQRMASLAEAIDSMNVSAPEKAALYGHTFDELSYEIGASNMSLDKYAPVAEEIKRRF